jgi:ATP-dependent exoDNAse (exonuclease V) beta subunit
MTAGGDHAARATALDPERSFIVQAPAGSGKTELLIQRYLALLATVEEPEQVVAITFTRKAAAEMRRRVVRALRAATASEIGTAPHEQSTLRLAHEVVARDAARDWSLLAQPQRLRIDTLDAFNVWLAQQLPLLADGVAAARIVEDATELYRRAAQRTLQAVGESSAVGAAVRTLARSFGNDFAALESLLATLLPKRDQWLAQLVQSSDEELRPLLERALRRLVDEHVAHLAELWPPGLQTALRALAEHAVRVATNDAVKQALAAWLAADGDMTGLAAARGSAALLQTQAGEWRKQLTIKEGFGPKYPDERERAYSLLRGLEPNDTLRTTLAAVASLPDPFYSEAQWQQLAALRVVLVRLAAELKLIFAEQRSVDFVELGLAARRALGQVDAPSELLLALDRRVQHLLVDEFQDTSQSQLRLLELLTAGWQDGDGRTLFLVGDPMQSIYRFRDADMSLFLKAKQRGVGTVRLESLALERNFRSAPAVVEWVNVTFAAVFPPSDDIATGTAAFRASAATRAASGRQFVQTHALRSVAAGDEIARVMTILAAERELAPESSIAVLVRSRSHLAGLREQLRRAGWPVHAVELESLAEQSVAQDLLGLARALAHLADRIAWLAVLRAPWCGLTWRDLAALAAGPRNRTLWEALHDGPQLATLTADGRRRAGWLTQRLDAAFAARGSAPFARWVEQTWRALDGADCLDDDTELRVAEQVFSLLAAAERRGDLDDPVLAQSWLERAQPPGDPPREQGIEIMTMHRAKGLEFDTVVLLGLARAPRSDDERALYWLERVAADGADDLLVAPLTGDEDDPLTAFVRDAERERERAERARLLYVATTRARERLHLVARLTPSDERPADGTLLQQIWPRVAAEFTPAELAVREDDGGARRTWLPVLRRLAAPAGPPDAPAAHALQLTFDAAFAAAPAPRPEFQWVGQAAVHVGTVVHRYLQRFAEDGLDGWNGAALTARAAAIERELRLLGVDAAELHGARERVLTALREALADERGRWILGPHDDARSELRITVRAGAVLEHIRLDRTFVADGVRWIVDFKTGQHEGADTGAFLDSEVQRYRPQLDRYAQALAVIDARPIEACLYFPLLRAFRSWRAA